MSEDKPKIYVASPLGFSECTRDFLYDKLIPTIDNAIDCEILDPWGMVSTGKFRDAESLHGYEERRIRLRELDKCIGSQNVETVKACDGLVACLDFEDPGTAFEMGLAFGLGKPIVAYLGDFRPRGDNMGVCANIMVEYPSMERGIKVARSLEELDKRLKEVFGK